MPLWLAAVLLALALCGIFLSRRHLRRGSAARALCITACVLLALAAAAYIGLTVLFVDAVGRQLPAP